MIKAPLRTVFCGTPDFSVPSLELLYHHPKIELVDVVSMPDRPAGRGQQNQSPPVIQFAKNHKLTFTQTENINKDLNTLSRWQEQKVDLIIVLAFAQFLNQKILKLPTLGCFNIHTSLLPKYRGAAPIQYALLNGDHETGVSIQKMVKQMDAGDLAISHSCPISDFETGGLLYTRLKFIAAESLYHFLNDLLKDRLSLTPQTKSGISFAPELKKELGHIDFENSKAVDILNKIRALQPWPGSYCFLGRKRLKIFSAQHIQTTLAPNQIDINKQQLLIGCKDSALRLTEVQLEGKKRCSDENLLRGLKEKFEINPK